MTDGHVMNSNQLKVVCCTSGCNEMLDQFQWKFTEKSASEKHENTTDYELNAIMTDFELEKPLQVICSFNEKILGLTF
jgi:hypothetical protein